MRWDNLLYMVYFFSFFEWIIYIFLVCLLNIFTCNFIVSKQLGPHLEELFAVWHI